MEKLNMQTTDVVGAEGTGHHFCPKQTDQSDAFIVTSGDSVVRGL